MENESETSQEQCVDEGEILDFHRIDLFDQILPIFVILAGIFISSLVFEQIIQRSSKWVKGNVLATQIRSTVIEEFTVLGLVSFVLFFTKYGIDLNTEHEYEREDRFEGLFEFVHMSMLIITVLFLMFVLYVAKLVGRHVDNWAKWEITDRRTIDREYQEAKKRPLRGILYLQYWKTKRQKMAFYFHTIRDAFLQHREDLPEQILDPKEQVFSKYLEHCLGIVILFVVNISWHIWAMFLCFVLFLVIFREIYVETVGDQTEIYTNHHFFLGVYAFSYAFMAFAWLIKSRTCSMCQRVHKLLTKGYSLSRDHTTDSTTLELQRGEGKCRELIQRRFYTICCRRETYEHPVIEAFPFRSPDFIIRFFQLNMLFQATAIDLFCLVFAQSGGIGITFKITYLFPIIYSVIFYVPDVLTCYTTCRFLGPLTNNAAIEKIIRKYSEDHANVMSESGSVSGLRSDSAFSIDKNANLSQVASQVGAKSTQFRRYPTVNRPRALSLNVKRSTAESAKEHDVQLSAITATSEMTRSPSSSLEL